MKQSEARRSPLGSVALYAVLILGSLIMIAPFVIMLVFSLWPNEAVVARRFQLDQITLSAYFETFRVIPFGRYFMNSAIVTVTATGTAHAQPTAPSQGDPTSICETNRCRGEADATLGHGSESVQPFPPRPKKPPGNPAWRSGRRE